MRSFWVFLACQMLSANAVAQTGAAVTLKPGEAVVLHLKDGALVVAERQAAAPLSAHESDVISKLQGISLPPDAGPQPAVPVTEGDTTARPVPITLNQVRITFRAVPGASRGPPKEPHAVLSILNGFGQSIRYRATMHKNGRASPTDVCETLPQLRGVEHWPYRIDRLDLSQLRLEPYEGGQPRCE